MKYPRKAGVRLNNNALLTFDSHNQIPAATIIWLCDNTIDIQLNCKNCNVYTRISYYKKAQSNLILLCIYFFSYFFFYPVMLTQAGMYKPVSESYWGEISLLIETFKSL